MKNISDPLHFSNLKKIAQSPAHFVASITHPKDTPPMRFGRLLATTVLGGAKYELWKGKRQGNAWKEFEAKFEGTDVDIFTEDEVAEAEVVAHAVLSDPVAAPLFVGEKELPAEWEVLGRKCATRGFDVLNVERSFLVDLKSTSNAEPGWFARHALRTMNYHAQLAWYLDAAHAIGKPVRESYIVAVETKPPYAVTVHRVTDRAIDEGRKLCRLWMERFLACENAGAWPSYVQSIVDLDTTSEDFGLLIDGEEVAA